MPITNGYCTLAEFKERFYPAGSDDLGDDKTIEAVITAVSREIDNYCHRRFWKNTNAETRYLAAAFYDLMFTPDIVSVTGVATDEDLDRTYSTALAVTDYDLEPNNAALDNEPYTRMRITPTADHCFLTSQKGNRLIGYFGWPAVPAPVNEACLLQSIRMFKRKDAPFGVMGTNEMGQSLVISKLDPDVRMLLAQYVRDKVVY